MNQIIKQNYVKSVCNYVKISGELIILTMCLCVSECTLHQCGVCNIGRSWTLLTSPVHKPVCGDHLRGCEMMTYIYFFEPYLITWFY